METSSAPKRVVVTGGAGFIGSHVCVSLLEAGHDILVIDNFDNSSPRALERVAQIVGLNSRDRLQLIEADLTAPEDRARIIEGVKNFAPIGAVHLAGLKAVGESVAKPQRYYHININSTLTLIEALAAADARAIVFSSSATVYGDLNDSPVSEAGHTGPTNPYGQTKFMNEQILTDLTRAPDSQWRICHLRYFNPVGAHPSGRIGEDPRDIPNNLFPYIAQVAVGRRKALSVFGNDYPTPDGTGVRDYIHVVDLADGHLKALDYLTAAPAPTAEIFNLGTGVGYSVLDAVTAFAQASDREIPYTIVDRRPGDIATIYADATRARNILGWTPAHDLDAMCADHWRWQSENPEGYGD